MPPVRRLLSHNIAFVTRCKSFSHPFLQWNGASLYNDINHSAMAITASFYPAFFFVDAARQNNRAFASADDENAALIYNYAPVFAPKEGLSTLFEQLYFFPAAGGPQDSGEELQRP